MKKHAIIAGLALAVSLTARADVTINENLSFGGYITGSYQVWNPDAGPSSDRLDLDLIKATIVGRFQPMTGTLSLFYPGPSGSEFTVLDAFVTYDMGGGSSITAGNFLSYLGYEAFDPVNMLQLSYAPVTAGTLAHIPAYHTGVRYDFSSDTLSAGIALLDSVNGATIYKGDGELRENLGIEAFVKFTGVPKLTVLAGVAYDTEGNNSTVPAFPPTHSVSVYDLWAEYQLGDTTKIAGEFAVKDGGPGVRGDAWLVLLNQTFSSTVSATFRVAGQKLSRSTVAATGKDDYMQYTISPAFTVNSNFAVGTEWSYYDYDAGGSEHYFGVQALFRF